MAKQTQETQETQQTKQAKHPGGRPRAEINESALHNRLLELVREGLSLARAYTVIKTEFGVGRGWIEKHHPEWRAESHNIGVGYRYRAPKNGKRKAKMAELLPNIALFKSLELEPSPPRFLASIPRDADIYIVWSEENKARYRSLFDLDPEVSRGFVNELEYLEDWLNTHPDDVEAKQYYDNYTRISFVINSCRAWFYPFRIRERLLHDWFDAMYREELTPERAIWFKKLYKELGDDMMDELQDEDIALLKESVNRRQNGHNDDTDSSTKLVRDGKAETPSHEQDNRDANKRKEEAS